jgi:DNA-binding CsgD family transcriptional regulator
MAKRDEAQMNPARSKISIDRMFVGTFQWKALTKSWPYREVTDVVQAGQALRTPYDAGQAALGRRWPMHQVEVPEPRDAIPSVTGVTVVQRGSALTRERDGGDNWAGQTYPVVTAEELTILALMAEGLTLDSVAVRVTMSPRTLSRRLRCVCDRLGVAHPIQAIVWAAHEGLI